MAKPWRGVSLATRIFLSTALLLAAAIGLAVAVTTAVGGRRAAKTDSIAADPNSASQLPARTSASSTSSPASCRVRRKPASRA